MLLILVVTVFSVAGSDKKKVISEGVADGNKAQAREKAIKDALRSAVEQGMGAFVTTELTVKQKKLVDEKITTETTGFVKSYKVIEEKEEDGLYTVKIEALIKSGKLRDELKALGLIQKKKGNPPVMVLVRSVKKHKGRLLERTEVTHSSKERSNTDVNRNKFRDVSEYRGVVYEKSDGSKSAENIIERELKEKNFRVIDSGDTVAGKVEKLYFRGDLREAGSEAREKGAEVIVFGEVRRNFVQRKKLYGRNYEFFSNELRIKAVNAYNGNILYSDAKKAEMSAEDVTEPVNKLAAKMTGDLIEKMAQAWRSDVYNGASYTLKAGGFSFKEISSLMNLLKKSDGVQSVNQRSYSKEKALVEIVSTGKLDAIAQALSGQKEISLEIIQMRGSELVIGKKD